MGKWGWIFNWGYVIIRGGRKMREEEGERKKSLFPSTRVGQLTCLTPASTPLASEGTHTHVHILTTGYAYIYLKIFF